MNLLDKQDLSKKMEIIIKGKLRIIKQMVKVFFMKMVSFIKEILLTIFWKEKGLKKLPIISMKDNIIMGLKLSAG